jgi:4-alpha-glucanotransferase
VLDELDIPNLIFPQLERNEDRSLKTPASYRTLSLCSYANHDHAPLAALYLRLRSEAKENPQGTAAQDLATLLDFIGWTGPHPAEMNDALLTAFQRALFQTPSLLATLMSSDLFGTPQRFNLPGSYGADTWNQRLEQPLSAVVSDPVLGPRVAIAAQVIAESGRTPPEGA